MEPDKEFQEILDKLQVSYIYDLKKPTINKKERGKLIRAYLTKHNLSQHQFAKRFGIPYNTVNDWMLFEKIEQSQVDKMIGNGLTDTDIYRIVRENRRESPDIETNIDVILQRMTDVLKKFEKTAVYTTQTVILIRQLKDSLNRLEMHAERKFKKR